MRLLASALAMLLFAALPARADISFTEAFPGTSLKGPEAAQGAFIWSHGIGTRINRENSQAATPVSVTVFRDHGWDVFRLNRDVMSEAIDSDLRELNKRIAELHARGYRRVVLGGQSAGAWLSVIAAGKLNGIHAIIANAPAYYGTGFANNQRNADLLYPYAEAIRGVRVMVSFFDGDPFDPGGRGPELERIFTHNGVPHLIIDRPAGFTGHGSGNGALFLRRFGACMLGVAGDGPMPAAAQCASDWGMRPSAELPVPKDLKPLTEAGAPAWVVPFLGRWYGYYGNGREAMLVIDKADERGAEGYYIYGPLPGGTSPAGATRRSGALQGDTLVMTADGKSAILYKPRPDGRLDSRWLLPDGHSALDAVLTRLP